MAHVHDVAIVGFGPVGATLAHLLGMQGIDTVVIERQPETWHLPRAVHFDDEIMRVFQWIGVADRLLPLLRVNVGMRFVDPAGNLLLDWPRPQEESALGWHPSWRFHQPDLETVLREALKSRRSVEVRTNCEVMALTEEADHVRLDCADYAKGGTAEIRARYVVGCDGARSMVRRAIGSEMRDLGFHERWLVLDLVLTRDKPELGDWSIQYCDPDRPATYVRGPGMRRRWEITVKDHETDAQVTAEPAVRELLLRWLAPDEATIERAAVYTFHSVIAEQWRRGRLMIAGDAAHQTPPFMGQGMCAGIRDAANLGWKLAEVLRGGPVDALLDSYQSERELNCEAFISTAVRLGRLINNADSEAALRDAMPRPEGGRKMASIYPPLGPGLWRQEAGGGQFGQPRGAGGARSDDVAPYEAVLLARDEVAAGLAVPRGVTVITDSEVPEVVAYLAAAGCGAVLLRPDRYVFGTAGSRAEAAVLLAEWRMALNPAA
jgi:3-(3-hydroxy-phenyl)propionate hydroxylase